MQAIEKQISVYFGVQPTDAAVIASSFEPFQLEKGAFLVKKEHYCDRLVLLQSGTIRFHAPARQKDITHWISTAGEMTTELSSFLFRTPSRWHLEAMQDCAGFSINRTDYLDLGSKLAIWESVQKFFVGRCFTAVEDRMFRHLSLNSEERFDWLLANKPGLLQSAPQQYIASMLGMTPETLSRIRTKQVGGAS